MQIAFTLNGDAVETDAPPTVTLLDWREHGAAYAQAMIEVAATLAAALEGLGLPVFKGRYGATASHQFAVRASVFGGGQACQSSRLRMI